MFTCFLPVWTPRAHGWKGYHEATICLTFKGFVLFISRLEGILIYLVFTVVDFQTFSFTEVIVLGESQNERRIDNVTGIVREQSLAFAFT